MAKKIMYVIKYHHSGRYARGRFGFSRHKAQAYLKNRGFVRSDRSGNRYHDKEGRTATIQRRAVFI